MFQIIFTLIIVLLIIAVVLAILLVWRLIKNAPLDRQVRKDLKAEQRHLDGLK